MARKPSLKKPVYKKHIETPPPPKLGQRKAPFGKKAPSWKPGQSGNPGGKPNPPELKLVKNLTRKELVHVGNLLVKNDLEALMWVASGEGKHSVLMVMIARVCVTILQKGDMQKLNQLLDRLIGPTRADIHLTGDLPLNSVSSRIVITLPSNGREILPPAEPEKTIDVEAEDITNAPERAG